MPSLKIEKKLIEDLNEKIEKIEKEAVENKAKAQGNVEEITNIEKEAEKQIKSIKQKGNSKINSWIKAIYLNCEKHNQKIGNDDVFFIIGTPKDIEIYINPVKKVASDVVLDSQESNQETSPKQFVSFPLNSFFNREFSDLYDKNNLTNSALKTITFFSNDENFTTFPHGLESFNEIAANEIKMPEIIIPKSGPYKFKLDKSGESSVNTSKPNDNNAISPGEVSPQSGLKNS